MLTSGVQTCQNCGAELVLRKGRFGAFYGCSNFPQCTFKVNARRPANVRQAVRWEENYFWGQYATDYISVGSSPSFVDISDIADDRFPASKVSVHLKGNKAGKSLRQTLVLQGLKKLLLRGEYAFCGQEVEMVLLSGIDIKDRPTPFENIHPELGYDDRLKLQSLEVTAAINHGYAAIKDRSTLDSPAISACDSPREKWFIQEWVPQSLGSKAVHWFIPQLPIDVFLQSFGVSNETSTRADFMLYVPGSYPIVVELDGDEHKDKGLADKQRDSELTKLKVKVFRVPNAEIDAGRGPQLDQLRKECLACLKGLDALPPIGAEVVVKSSAATQLQWAILSGLDVCSTDDEVSEVAVAVTARALDGALIEATISDLNSLIKNYTALFFEGSARPLTIKLTKDKSKAQLKVSMCLDQAISSICPDNLDADVIVARAIMPVSLLPPRVPKVANPSLKLTNELASKPLTYFLNLLFRKRVFRGQQLDAICNILRDKDTLVLQPTGAGKSIIYQLSGLLLPGVTIIIDPIKALIEDQVLGLRDHRITRSAGLTSKDGDQTELREMLSSISSNHVHFILMSPERLLTQALRNTLALLVKETSINLAVIDEAHCMSQWGHSFRFAYLRLSENLRKYCTDEINGMPKLLALTGTASRTVLKEMVAELGITLSDEGSIIKPATFDRAELVFSVSEYNQGGATFGQLRHELDRLPSKLSKERDAFYEPNGRNTNSGIIFTPHARGETHGLLSIQNELSSVSDHVGVFASKVPEGYSARDWEKVKSAHARAFKNNDEPILIATSAFGMGVDKPNIRWTVHLGIPNSIESFYQEAGRAGRDRNKSHCAVIFSETDQTYTDSILSPLNTFDEMKAIQRKRKPADDVDRAVYFHLSAFTSIDEELDQIKAILEQANYVGMPSTVQIGYQESDYSKQEERMKEVQRSIIRMSYCGLIEDYIIDYSGKYFTVSLSEFNFGRSISKLESYVRKVQPAATKSLLSASKGMEDKPSNEQTYSLCKWLIDFTYNVIERSRRRMILETVQLARNGNDNDAIKERLLNYLKEGAHAARITDLAEEPSIKLNEWVELTDDISNRSEAKEMRGDVGRTLEAYPEHAGLLLARSVSEALSGDGSRVVIRDNMKAAVDYSLRKYDISMAEVNQLFVDLLRRTNDGLQAAIEPLLEVILERQKDGAFVLDDEVGIALSERSDSWDAKDRNLALQLSASIIMKNAAPILRSQSANITNSLKIIKG